MSARPLVPVDRVVAWGRRNPIAAASVAVVALVVLIVFATVFGRYRSVLSQKERADAALIQALEKALENAKQAEQAIKRKESEVAAATAAEKSARDDVQKTREREKLLRDSELRALEREKIAREGEQKAREEEKKAKEDFFKAQVALDQGQLAWHRQHAEQWEKSGQWTAAAFHLGRLIEANPKDEKLLVRRADAYRESAQWLPAAADYSRALALKSDLPVSEIRDRCLARSLPVQTSIIIALGETGPLLVVPLFERVPWPQSR